MDFENKISIYMYIYIGNTQIICSPILLDFIVTRTQNWNTKHIYYVLIYKIIPHSINELMCIDVN